MLDQPATVCDGRLDVGVIGDAHFTAASGVVAHPRDHELVEPIARPAGTAAERLDDQQRSLEPGTPFECSLQCKVGVSTPVRIHPIDNELAIRAKRALVASTDSNFGNSTTIQG